MHRQTDTDETGSTLTCSLSGPPGGAAKRVLCLVLMPGIDPVEKADVETSSDRPGLESPELEAGKQDLCRGRELRRSRMRPECEDRLRVSLQPARMSCNTNTCSGGLEIKPQISDLTII